MTSTDIAEMFAPHVLREYALLADGEHAALVNPQGNIAWMCAPRWDSDGVFSCLIGGHGSYAVTPTGRFVWGGYYEDGSLIWRSLWITESGITECREALRFPGDPRRAVLLRRIIAVQGTAHIDVVLKPAAGFGRHHLRELHRDPDGRWRGILGELRLRWTGAAAVVSGEGRSGRGLRTTITVPEGAHHDLVLEIGDTALGEEPPDPDRAWQATVAAWREALPQLRDTVAPDGAHPLLDDAVGFVSQRLLADGPNLMPAYTVTGQTVPDQWSLDLPGYPGGADIVGNHVNAQFQLDAFGEALLLFAAAARHDHLDSDHHKALIVAVGAIEARWRQPDAGLWELDNQRWAHSRLICAAGLRAIAGAGVPAANAAGYSALADAILADTDTDCLHPSGRWQRAPGDPRVDAALLLPAIRGAVPAADARTLATLRAVRDELDEQGYVYRFRQDARRLREAEGAFLLCGFLMALAAHQQGDTVAATRWFERNRAACGPPGLFSEEYDVAQRQLRGNLPQAFVHALMLETSIRLTGPWQDPFRRNPDEPAAAGGNGG